MLPATLVCRTLPEACATSVITCVWHVPCDAHRVCVARVRDITAATRMPACVEMGIDAEALSDGVLVSAAASANSYGIPFGPAYRAIAKHLADCRAWGASREVQ